MEPEVLVEHDNGLVIVTINRPAQRNAVNRAVSYGVCEAPDEMDRMISAERLYQYGLINILTEPGGALDAAKELARRIVVNAPLSVAASKRVIVEQRDWSLDEMFARQEAITGPVLKSRDAREGSAAFAERRAAVWTGA